MHPLETAAEAVWARERAGCSDKKKLLRLGARPSESSPLTLHHSLIKNTSENTQFEKKQETIFEKDVITSQFTLPALCYGVCVCVYVCACVWTEDTNEYSKPIKSTASQLLMVSHSAQRQFCMCVCLCVCSFNPFCRCWQCVDFLFVYKWSDAVCKQHQSVTI